MAWPPAHSLKGRSDEDLPPFDEYTMDNRTYRYFRGRALFPFGHGLSYTTFKYDDLKIDEEDGGAEVKVDVTNTGNRDGEEVVQLYVSGEGAGAPIRSLKGFQRIFLKAGEKKKVKFDLTAEDLSIMNNNGQPQRLKGNILIAVGGGQPTAEALMSKNATMGRVKGD